MRIAWVADYTLNQNGGGAQRTNQIMIEKGLELGFKIKEIDSEEVNKNCEELHEFDLVILNNIVKIKGNVVDWISHNVKYARYEHDYDAVWRIKEFPDLYINAALNIFLSPLHLKEIGLLTKVGNYILIPSPIEKFYKDHHREREHDLAILAGNITDLKISDLLLSFIKRSLCLRFEFYYLENPYMPLVKTIMDIADGKVKMFVEVKPEKLAENYNRAKYFIHLPKWTEPYGRTVMEAKLCGCDIIMTENIGAASYDWFYLDPDNIREIIDNSPKRFWEAISNL